MRTVRKPKQGPRIEHNRVTEAEWLRMCSDLYHSLARETPERPMPEEPESVISGAEGLVIPDFATVEEYDAWCETLPSVEPDVDPRLCESVKTSIRLSRLVIEGFSYLAEQRGIRSGQTLMKMVLDNYVAKNLPPDF